MPRKATVRAYTLWVLRHTHNRKNCTMWRWRGADTPPESGMLVVQSPGIPPTEVVQCQGPRPSVYWAPLYISRIPTASIPLTVVGGRAIEED